MFKGKILIAGLRIDEYGITKKENSIRICARLPGGMRIFIKNFTDNKNYLDSEQPL